MYQYNCGSIELVLSGTKQEPGFCGINPAIGIINSVGHLTGTVVRYDSNNNGRDASAVQEGGNKILAIGRGRFSLRKRDFCLFILKHGAVTDRK